jgi:hypothetical protein
LLGQSRRTDGDEGRRCGKNLCDLHGRLLLCEVFAISCSDGIGSAWLARPVPKVSVKEPLLAGSNLFMVDERRIFVRVVGRADRVEQFL